MVFLWLLLAIVVVGIVFSFRMKKSRVKQEELQSEETIERLPKFKFDE
ncbi:hypothetical protein [Neobacillus cucumis]|nr:hypothetical protein [Neobacillus cucumis]